MATKNDLIILDTNLWISFLITKDYSSLDKILFSKQCKLLFSPELIEEFIEVAKRTKFKKYFSEDDLKNLLNTIDQYAQIIAVKSDINICRDPKDNFLLSLAIDGEADFLLTGDSDLLELRTINQTQIITISEYLEKK